MSKVTIKHFDNALCVCSSRLDRCMAQLLAAYKGF